MGDACLSKKVKYRDEEDMIADFLSKARESANANVLSRESVPEGRANANDNFGFALPENVQEMTDEQLAVWYNDNVIYPDGFPFDRLRAGCRSPQVRCASTATICIIILSSWIYA